jgi:hypothetical protein
VGTNSYSVRRSKGLSPLRHSNVKILAWLITREASPIYPISLHKSPRLRRSASTESSVYATSPVHPSRTTRESAKNSCGSVLKIALAHPSPASSLHESFVAVCHAIKLETGSSPLTTPTPLTPKLHF